MSIIVGCTRCGKGIEVDDETLDLFKSSGQPISASHEKCPDEDDHQNRYRVLITVFKNDERIAQVGETILSPDFETAFPILTKAVNGQWEQVESRAGIADMDNPGQ